MKRRLEEDEINLVARGLLTAHRTLGMAMHLAMDRNADEVVDEIRGERDAIGDMLSLIESSNLRVTVKY
jgi:hypothetical protein